MRLFGRKLTSGSRWFFKYVRSTSSLGFGAAFLIPAHANIASRTGFDRFSRCFRFSNVSLLRVLLFQVEQLCAVGNSLICRRGVFSFGHRGPGIFKLPAGGAKHPICVIFSTSSKSRIIWSMTTSEAFSELELNCFRFSSFLCSMSHCTCCSSPEM